MLKLFEVLKALRERGAVPGAAARTPGRTRRAAALGMAVLGVTLACCEGTKPAEEDTLSIAVWNVQTLYDGEDAGTEFDEFRASAGWTREKYEARLLSLSRAVERMLPISGGKGTPDVLALVEVENLEVLGDLAGGELAKYGYLWTCFGKAPRMGLGVGVLSRYPLTGVRVHSITVAGSTVPRPVLEVRVEYGGESGGGPGSSSVVLFVCH